MEVLKFDSFAFLDAQPIDLHIFLLVFWLIAEQNTDILGLCSNGLIFLGHVSIFVN